MGLDRSCTQSTWSNEWVGDIVPAGSVTLLQDSKGWTPAGGNRRRLAKEGWIAKKSLMFVLSKESKTIPMQSFPFVQWAQHKVRNFADLWGQVSWNCWSSMAIWKILQTFWSKMKLICFMILITRPNSLQVSINWWHAVLIPHVLFSCDVPSTISKDLTLTNLVALLWQIVKVVRNGSLPLSPSS